MSRDTTPWPQPEPGLTAATLIERAEALVPMIREQAADAEARGYFSDELLEKFREAGFYRMFLPKMWGGYEVSHETFLEVSYQIGRGDAGTAWCYTLSASHIAIVASVLSEDAQRELLEAHGEIRAPHRAVPSGKAEKVEGGYLISGRWRFSSGIPVSTHFMANTMAFPEDGEPEEFAFITARENVTIIEDWGGGRGLGVQASGSHTVAIDEPLFVPERHIIRQDLLFGTNVDWGAGTPGTELHGTGRYIGVFGGFYHLCFAAIFAGAAQNAVDQLREFGQKAQALMQPPGTLMQDVADIQRQLGDAAAKADAAHAILIQAARMSDGLLERWDRTREPITKAETMRIWALGRQAAFLACDAIQIAFQAAGPAAVSKSSPLQRILRDAQIYLGHASSQPHIALARGQGEFGVPIAFGAPEA